MMAKHNTEEPAKYAEQSKQLTIKPAQSPSMDIPLIGECLKVSAKGHISSRLKKAAS